MKKLILLIFLAGCIGDTALLKTIEGKTWQEVVARLGPPDMTEPDGVGGQKFTYTRPVIGGTGYRYIYVNKEGRVYFWKWHKEAYPVDRVNVNVYHRY